MNREKYIMPEVKSYALRGNSRKCLCASLINGDNGQTQYDVSFDDDEDSD